MFGAGVSHPWSQSENEILDLLRVHQDVGLSSNEASIRLEKFGLNVLKAESKVTVLQRILSQLKSPVVIILMLATVFTALLGEYVDSIAIAFIVAINSIIGYFQEAKAEAAVDALKKLSAPKARVLRDGNISEKNGSEICPGDILILEAGDFVPADCRVIQASQLSADESTLTGESLPVNKTTHVLLASAALADRKNMLFATTAVTTGSARVVVTATSMETEIGRIAGLLEGKVSVKTPLQKNLEQVSNKLLLFCAAVILVVAALGIIHGEKWLDVLLTAVSLSVAAIPEGLPTVVTLALTMAVGRMTKRNAIVKHLPAVETLGSTNVICTDKTGTLTTGKMRVREVFLPGDGILTVEGLKTGDSNRHQSLIQCGVLCSNASLSANDQATGDPTEVALLYLAKDLGLDPQKVFSNSTRLAEWSFDSGRKRMSVAVELASEVLIYCKGAPEAVVPLCNLNDLVSSEVQTAMEKLSSSGRRILAIAFKKMAITPNDFHLDFYKDYASVENNLVLIGLVAISDPPRIESIPAIADCKSAGIKVVMITGDHPVTAKAIAKELGIVEDGKFDQVISGLELDGISAQVLEERVEMTAVYARVTPEHKLRIIKAWQNKGNVVAMTGDGVNDAPALKQASIGIAMGKGGTEVARQASSMILTDDNFSTIVAAVEEGRAIYGNIRRTIQYLLSGNFSEILIMLGAAIVGWPAPLAPIHLLWINLVTDGLPALALAAEPVAKNVLGTTKRPSPTTFFDKFFYREMAFVGILTALMTLAVYGYTLKYEDELTARTYAFSFLVFAELFRSFASRSETKTFFQMGFTSNIYHLVAVAVPIAFQIILHHTDVFRNAFKVGEISWAECFALAVLAMIPVTIIELRKLAQAKTRA